MISSIKYTHLFLFFFLFLASANGNGVESIPEKVRTCVACHGESFQGIRILNAPSLADLSELYLIRQLENFQKGIRGSHPKDIYGQQMTMSAINLSSEDLNEITSYIVNHSKSNLEKTVYGDLEKGEFVFQHCMSCHGEFAEGDMDIGAPKLSGLNDWYLLNQLLNFKNEIRGIHPDDLFGKQMMETAQMFNEEMLKDVVAYISEEDFSSQDDKKADSRLRSPL